MHPFVWICHFVLFKGLSDNFASLTQNFASLMRIFELLKQWFLIFLKMFASMKRIFVLVTQTFASMTQKFRLNDANISPQWCNNSQLMKQKIQKENSKKNSQNKANTCYKLLNPTKEITTAAQKPWTHGWLLYRNTLSYTPLQYITQSYTLNVTFFSKRQNNI